MTETIAKTHSQTVDQAQEVFCRSWERIEEHGRDRGLHKKTVESINLYTWSFPEFEPPAKKHTRTGPSPFSALHICSRCSAWSSYGSPKNRSRVLAWLCWLLADPVLLKGFIWLPWEMCLLMQWTEVPGLVDFQVKERSGKEGLCEGGKENWKESGAVIGL